MRLRQDSGSDARVEQRRQGRRVSLAAQWMLRQEEGRAFLGSAMADIRYGAELRRIMQTHNADDCRRVPVSGSPAQMGQSGVTAVPSLGGAETISHYKIGVRAKMKHVRGPEPKRTSSFSIGRSPRPSR